MPIALSSIFIPFSKLTRLVHPMRRGGIAVLFRAYLDDSTDEKARIFTVGGFAARDQSWEQLEPRWLEFLDTLRPKGISYFHTTDCFAGANEFERIDIQEREEILDTAVALVLQHQLRLIGSGLDEEAYKKFAPKAKRNDFGVNKYVVAFGGAIEGACANFNTSLPFGGNPDEDFFDFYIENSMYKVSAMEAIRQLKNVEKLWFHDRIGNDIYGDKRGPHAIPLLQVADLGAFLANKHLSKTKDGRIPWTKYFNQLLDAGLVKHFGVWNAEVLAVLKGIQGLTDLSESEFE